jgi:two-component system cell cycle response regulator CtrA
MRVLTVGLDRTTIEFLKRIGFTMDPQHIHKSEELGDWLREGDYGAAIVDLEASNLGIFFCRELRSRNIPTGVVGISSGSDTRLWSDHRAMFLENGGDDLLRGPANPRELAASIRAMARRLQGSLLDVFETEHNGTTLKVNLTTRSVYLNGVELDLTGRELAMMMVFAESPGRPISKEAFLSRMYSDQIGESPDPKIVDVFICKIRSKFDELYPGSSTLIETEWGKGYQIPRGNRSKNCYARRRCWRDGRFGGPWGRDTSSFCTK